MDEGLFFRQYKTAHTLIDLPFDHRAELDSSTLEGDSRRPRREKLILRFRTKPTCSTLAVVVASACTETKVL